MKFLSSARLLGFSSLLVSSADSYTPNSPEIAANRRSFLTQTSSLAAVLWTTSQQPAHAGLLDEFGTDPSKIVQAAPKTSTPVVATKKSKSSIEPNLRSNYYYPTNKARYLPRIKKCSEQINAVATQIGDEDWEAISTFATKTADDTILPLKLYASSLTGGGTNVKVAYVKTLNTCANQFESNQKMLVKAVSKKDSELCATAVQGMSEALTTYRSTAGLNLDFGALPSVDEIRRASSRKNLTLQSTGLQK